MEQATASHPTILAARIVRIIENTKINVTTERAAHDAIADALIKDGMDVQREVVLSPKDRIDIIVDGIGVEVKTGHSRRAIHAQLVRYARLDAICGLVLATGVAWPTSMREVNGKPFRCASLSRGWL